MNTPCRNETQPVRSSNQLIVIREKPHFLRLIALFFNSRVLGYGLRLALTGCILARYERVGFFFLVLSVAF